jgi:hypothetical protein
MRKAFLLTFLVVLVIAMHSLSASAQTINACYQKNEGQLRKVNVPADCRPSEIPVSWNMQGPAGPKGDKGEKGDKGDKGDPGTGGPFVYIGRINMFSLPGAGSAAAAPIGFSDATVGGAGVVSMMSPSDHLLAGQFKVRFRNPAAATITFDLTFVDDLGVTVGDTSCTIAAGAIECTAPVVEVFGAGKVYIGMTSAGAQTSDALFRWRVTLP